MECYNTFSSYVLQSHLLSQIENSVMKRKNWYISQYVKVPLNLSLRVLMSE